MKKYSLDKVAIRMVKEPPLYSDTPIHTPDDAVRLMAEILRGYDREVLCVVNMQSDLTPINMNIVSVGTLNASIIHPREVLKSTVLSNAAAVMLFHNHPSGNLLPSQEDIETTDRMQQLYTLMGIQLLDHIIIGNDDRYYSFQNEDIMPLSKNYFPSRIEEQKLDAAKKKTAEHAALQIENLRKYFPKSYTTDQIEDIVIKLLEQWRKKKQREQAR